MSSLHSPHLVRPTPSRALRTSSQNFVDSLMFGAPRQLMLENDYVQHGAFKAGGPATHAGKIKYPQVGVLSGEARVIGARSLFYFCPQCTGNWRRTCTLSSSMGPASARRACGPPRTGIPAQRSARRSCPTSG